MSGVRTVSRAGLDDLAAFVAVARVRSFTRAAAELRVSTSALSHTVKGLEARLGVRLLQRNSRNVSVTVVGEQLFRALEPAFADIGGALEELDRTRDLVAGTVRLTATRHAFETIIRPMMRGFLTEYPQVRLEVLIDYQLRDIIADRLDAGIRLGENLEKDMVAVGVGPELRMAVVASPAYLAEHAAPQTPHDLTGHRCVNYRMMTSGQTYDWEFERDGRALKIKVTGPLTFNEPELMLEAALDGLGVAYILEQQASQHVSAGRLIRLLDAWTPPFSGYFLYYPSRRQIAPALVVLIAALRRLRSPLTPDTSMLPKG
jgi:DNA-binding transcriptional LysR family regulator